MSRSTRRIVVSAAALIIGVIAAFLGLVVGPDVIEAVLAEPVPLEDPDTVVQLAAGRLR
jgi:hypothetical protein